MMRTIFAAASLSALAACSTQNELEPAAPAREAVYDYGMVAAADPRAVEAGVKVLQDGGTAVDAAIAVHSVLSLVEPQSSGLGGGAFMVVYQRETGKVTVLDGRETAPMAASANLFYDDNGEVMDFVTAWQSGRSVGVPGQVALYETAHDMFGEAEWESLFLDATQLAEDGFVVSPRLADLLANPRLRAATQLDKNPDTAAYFYPGGAPLAAGDIRTNPEFAEVLKAISANGAGVFYEGDIAEAIVSAASAGPNGGSLTLEDIAAYEVIVREPLCGEALTYLICSAPPPSSGGSTQPAIVGLYERLSADLEPDDKEGRLQAFVDAQRLAYADRDHYIADADHVFVPAEDLFNQAYLDVRATERFAPDANPQPGDPGEVLRGEPLIDLWGRDKSDDAPGTTHISVVDRWGNAVAMTSTVESAFGSSRWSYGFLLNNELTDFSREAVVNGKPVANAPGPGKRPRSSMSPTLVFDAQGRLFMVTGSPGGNSIIAYVSKTLVGVLDWDMSAQEAVDLPNIIARGGTVGVETSRGEHGAAIGETLTSMGYDVRERSGENSGLHVIIVRGRDLEGAADPRREGVALKAE